MDKQEKIFIKFSLKKIGRFLIDSKIIILFIMASLLFIRIYNLDADPPLWKRIGDIFDEGLWIHNARNLVLFGRLMMDSINLWVLTPLMTLLWYISFKIIGVNFFSARIVCALFGFLTIVLIYWSLSKSSDKKIALISLLLLGFNSTFLMYNRLALLETPLVFSQVMCLVFLYIARRKKLFYFLLGIVFALGLLIKPYILFLGVLLTIRLWEIMHEPKGRRIKPFLNSIFLMSCGFFAIIIPYLILLVRPNAGVFKYIFGLYAEVNLVFNILHFFYILFNQLINLFSVDILGQAPIFILLTIVLSYLIWFIASSKPRFLDSIKKLDAPSAYVIIWLFAGILIAQFSNFFDRRQVLFIVPLGLVSAKVIANLFWTSKTKDKGIALLTNTRLALFLIGLICSMYGVLLRFIFKAQYTLVGGLTRGYLIGVIFMIFSIIYFIGISKYRVRLFLSRWAPLLLLFSLLGLALPKVIYLWGVEVFGFMHNIKNVQIFSIAILAMLMLVIIIYKHLNISYFVSKGIMFFILFFYVFVNAAETYSSVIAPTFTLRDESRRIGGLVPKGAVVSGSFASEMGIENDIFPLHPELSNNKEDWINKDYKAGYYLFIKDFNWLDQGYQRKTDNLDYLTTVHLFPSPFVKDRFKLVMDFYSGSKESIFDWKLQKRKDINR